MELTVIQDGRKIRRANHALTVAIKACGGKFVPTTVGFRGESYRRNVLWSDGLGIWMLSQVIDGSRYWNAFGVDDPKKNNGVGITCEINFPLSGTDRRVAGAVAEDAAGALHILHRGRIGGGRAGVGAELFWAHFAGCRALAADGDRKTEFAFVGAVGSTKLASDLQVFVKEVDRIKGLRTATVAVIQKPDGVRCTTTTEGALPGKNGETERATAAALSNTKVRRVADILIRMRSTQRSDWYWIGGPGRRARTKKSANKFILGCLLDYQMKLPSPWENAKRLAEQVFGDPETLWETIVSSPLSQWVKKFSEYRIHRFSAAHARVWKIGKRIVDRYDGDARRIWEGVSAEEATQRLIEIGVGNQLSRMAVGGLHDCGLVTGVCDLKADIHVNRVLGRVFFNRPATPDASIELSRRMYPENPWLLDAPLWSAGSRYCRPNEPKCQDCFLRDLCAHAQRQNSSPQMTQ